MLNVNDLELIGSVCLHKKQVIQLLFSFLMSPFLFTQIIIYISNLNYN